MDATAGASPIVAPTPERATHRGWVVAWLVVVVVMLMAMVVVGGATRLTHSGLSITEWQPIHGVIPPLSASDWQEEFAKYQQIPEYQQLNKGMSLQAFKSLFWWEWAHRLLGRAIGAVVLLPLVFFWATASLEAALKPRIVLLFLLGGLQGAVGWWMVASGLTERTDVSQYRLAIHLTLACAILAYTVWLTRGLLPGSNCTRGSVRAVSVLIVGLAFLQIFLGGLVAGLDAGLTFNTWPLMDGALVPSGMFGQVPWWRNLFENVATVQFDHRLGAYLLFAVVLAHSFQARETAAGRSAAILAGLVTLQAFLGVLTLLYAVPLQLGLLHQFGAVVVLSFAVVHLRAQVPPLRGKGE